jgi:Family of unknown function (DUF6526)
MTSEKPQTYENHARYLVAYHGVAFGIFVVNLLWSCYRVATDFGLGTIVNLLLAFGFLLLFFYARRFALTVQDRVVRLETRLRLAQILPADLRSEIGRFTLDQLIALRFAGDDELPALARRVLDEGLTDRDAIKKLVKNWQADLLRV